MKKYLALLLLVLAIFSLTSCNKYKGPLDGGIKRIGEDGSVGLIDVDSEHVDKMFDILNDGKWEEFDGDYEYDYEFHTENETIRYDSKSKTFYDVTNGLKLTIS